jgi:hypothetical protein
MPSTPASETSGIKGYNFRGTRIPANAEMMTFYDSIMIGSAYWFSPEGKSLEPEALRPFSITPRSSSPHYP